MTTEFKLLRSRLEIERKRLTGELKQLTVSLRPANERREGSPFVRDQLADVEHALTKFEQGTYGTCDSCGQPIDPARLDALPQASLCLSCKAKNAKGTSSPR